MRGAQVPPSRAGQVLYTTVAETKVVTDSAGRVAAEFEVPARVPVERVSFVLAPGYEGSFSSDVRITARGVDENGETGGGGSRDTGVQSGSEVVPGGILRVHSKEAGSEIRAERLSVPAILGANMQRDAKVAVTFGGVGEAPPPIVAVRLEMRQRKLCFDAAAGMATRLGVLYGDPTLVVPTYEYQRVFRASQNAGVATLGPEEKNPAFQPRAARERRLTERHPEVLWIGLIGGVCGAGMVALRAARRAGR